MRNFSYPFVLFDKLVQRNARMGDRSSSERKHKTFSTVAVLCGSISLAFRFDKRLTVLLHGLLYQTVSIAWATRPSSSVDRVQVLELNYD